MKGIRYICTAALLALAVTAMGCATPAPQEDFPAPNYLGQALNQRADFVQAFLQGRWCEAENLLALSTENFLQLDRFCDAGYNYLLSWRLKAYVGLDEPEALDKARKMRNLGDGCAANPRLAIPEDGQVPEAMVPEKDQAYRRLIAEQDFAAVVQALADEENELFASVYARKAAKAAMAASDAEAAHRLLEFALAVDSRLGWVVFLRQDWLLKAELADDDEERQTIMERIGYLDAFITPCP